MNSAITSRSQANAIDAFRLGMPGMLRHEGVWSGVYRHFSPDATLLEQHEARIECVFPTSGPYVYVQHNTFTWTNGEIKTTSLPAVFRDGKLWWDVETFEGWAWESEFGIILLNLFRKDDPGANFLEMITLSDSGQHRARTWHWFKNGALIRRTTCDETRVE